MWNRRFLEVAILAPKVCSTSLGAWGVIESFEEEICTFQYAPQVNWNWRAYKRTCFFNSFEFHGDWNFPEVAILALKICYSSLYACGVFDSSDEKICTFWYGPQLNWNWKVYKGTSFFQWFWIICLVELSWIICRVELSRSSHFGAKSLFF